MKKYLVTFGFVMILMLSGYWIWKEYTDVPPEPIVMIGDKKIEVVRGTYCWRSQMKGVCEDTFAAPPELIAANGIKTIAAPPEATVTIEFERKPIEGSFHFTRWINDKEEIEVVVKENEYVLPKEQGSHIYGLSANWEQGDAVYAFVIDVA